MALRTTVGNGNWNTAGTWDTGVPVNGDTFLINGHTVTFDADQSGFASGVSGTNNGSLVLTTTAGSYYMKLSGNVTGTGSMLFGSSGSPVASNVFFTLDHGSASQWQCTGDVKWYGADPGYAYVTIPSLEASGQTVLSVDTDVSSLWPSDGTGEVAVYRYHTTGYGYVSFDLRTIASGGITATEITITSALSADKEAGSLIILLTRNLRVKCTSTSVYSFYRGSGTGVYVFDNVAVYPTTAHTGGFIHNATSASITLSGKTIVSRMQNNCLTNGLILMKDNAVQFAVDRGSSRAFNPSSSYAYSSVIQDNVLCCGVSGGWCVYFGKITGNAKVMGVRTAFTGDALLEGTNVLVDNCRELGENSHVVLGKGVTVTRSGGIRTSGTLELKQGCTFSGTFTGGPEILFRGNGADWNGTFNAYLYGYTNGLIGSGLDWSKLNYIYNVGDGAGNAQPGRHLAWSSGGKTDWILTASAPASPPFDPTFFHRMTYEASGWYNFIDIPITTESNTPIKLTIIAANSATGSFVQLPVFELRDASYDVNDSAGILGSATMADSTSWQTLELNYAPTSRKSLVLRCYGARSSGYTYWNYRVKTGVPVLAGMAGGFNG